jgi:hypothetical protein
MLSVRPTAGGRPPIVGSESPRTTENRGVDFAENVPFAILPFFVLYAIYLQVDYLTRQAGPKHS